MQANIINPSSKSIVVEAKIGARLPDGTPVNLFGKHLELPLEAGLDKTFNLIDTSWPAGMPTGTWSVEGTLLEPKPGETFSREVKPFEVVQ